MSLVSPGLRQFVEARVPGKITSQEFHEILLEARMDAWRDLESVGLGSSSVGHGVHGTITARKLHALQDAFSPHFDAAGAEALERYIAFDGLGASAWKTYSPTAAALDRQSPGVFDRQGAKAFRVFRSSLPGDPLVARTLPAALERRYGTELAPQPRTPQPVRPETKPAGAVDAARAVIRRLEAEIARLERDHADKTARISQTIRSIEARKAELQREYENKRTVGIIGALFGAPALAAVSLMQMQKDDARLRSLDQSLADLGRDKSKVQRDLSAYRAMKADVQAKVDALRQEEPQLVPARWSDGLRAPARSVAAAAARADAHVRLHANLESQVVLLTGIRDAAAALNVQLDGVLRSATLELRNAEAALKASRRELVELLKLAFSGDPQAASLRWLEKKVSAQTRALVDDTVKRLVQRSGATGVQAQLLQRELVRVLGQSLEGLNGVEAQR
jgi:hypothetical protein